jgi:RNA polymerase sigma-70 factor, ECF subfamily
MTKTDEILISIIKQDDYSGFNRLFFKYYSSLCSYVDTIITDSSGAEDIVQNLFIKLWSDRKKILINKDINSYLFRAAKNSAMNYLRAERNRKKAINNLEIINVQQEKEESNQEEFLQKLEECINQLPERSKEVLLMHRFEELRQKEIAERLNISIKTIKNQLWKSLRYLKSCLEEKKIHFQ